jgi:nicotinate-nucleotide adenylyltransferase
MSGHREDQPTTVARIGVLGGTFDPVHVGHIELARAARRELGLDRVLVIPAARPPHKLGVELAPAADRLAMVELAVAGEEGLIASPIEVGRSGPSWTIDTLMALRDEAEAVGQPAQLTLILSADAFAGLPTWHEPERIVRMARIAVAPRPGHPPPAPDALPPDLRAAASEITILDGPNVDVSATDIRRRVADGLSIDGLVPAAVARYIEEHHLYQHPAPTPSEPANEEAT